MKSGAVMSYDKEKIRTRISNSLEVSGIDPSGLQSDIVFHMTDWLDEMELFQHFCEDPSSFNPEEINNLLITFLTHVPNHLAAASKLFLGIPVTDIFNVGSTSEE
jgi:hypothetical protein